MGILIKPLITEKATEDSKLRSCYSFLVNPKSNKIEIKNEVVRFYGVTVKDIRTMVCNPKKKVHFRKKAWVMGRGDKTKKAIVELEAGQTINLFSNN
ncbi:MAG: 50S ribosomal protein L23 [Flavobacteriales bacterium Tduv]